MTDSSIKLLRHREASGFLASPPLMRSTSELLVRNEMPSTPSCCRSSRHTAILAQWFPVMLL
jgi:hypothetical protein